jgi:uncharacterized protein YkwD
VAGKPPSSLQRKFFEGHHITKGINKGDLFMRKLCLISILLIFSYSLATAQTTTSRVADRAITGDSTSTDTSDSLAAAISDLCNHRESLSGALARWCQRYVDEDSGTVDPEEPPAPPSEDPIDDKQPPVGDGSAILPQEQEVVRLLNQERSRHGLSPVTHNSQLHAAATRHSQDMAENGFLSHTGSDGSSPFERMHQAGYQYKIAAENVAAGQSSAEAVIKAWMNSSGHRQNMLTAGFCDVGVGYDYNSNSTFRHYWTMKLGCQ